MVYYTLLSLAVLISSLAPSGTLLNSKYVSRFLSFLLLLLGCGVILSNEVQIDMHRYLTVWEVAAHTSIVEFFHRSRFERGFMVFLWIGRKVFSSPDVFRVFVAIIFWLLIHKYISMVFEEKSRAYTLFLYFNFFYFWSFSTNVIRQGLAVGLLMVAVGLLLNDRPRSALVLICVATLFHSTAVMGLLIFLLNKLKWNTRTIIIIWGLMAITFITGLNRSVVEKMLAPLWSSRYLDLYTSTSAMQIYGSSGNRLDFFVFSFFWVIWGIFAKKFMVGEDKIFDLLFQCYLGLNMIFLLFGFIAFSDRVAGYSWLLIPPLMAYPVWNSKSKYRKLQLVAGFMLSVFFAGWFGVIERFTELKIWY